MSTVPVVLGIPYTIQSNEIYLWMQRRETNDFLNGLWEFPGGKIEDQETPSSACIRELEEEIGLKSFCLNEDEVIGPFVYRYPSISILFYSFLIKDASFNEAEGKWFPLKSLERETNMPSATRLIVQKVTNFLENKNEYH